MEAREVDCNKHDRYVLTTVTNKRSTCCIWLHSYTVHTSYIHYIWLSLPCGNYDWLQHLIGLQGLLRIDVLLVERKLGIKEQERLQE